MTRIVFGTDAVDRLGAVVRDLGARRAFLVTDPGIVAAGHVARAERALAAADVEARRYDAVHENPSTVDVDACREALGDWDAEVLVGLGGGSSIDVAKGCAFLRAGGGQMADYWGVGKAKGELLPLVAVPTTAGTGSEVQSFALIEQEGTHQKMACGDRQAAPAVALLDPTLTITQPPFVTACTGLDAIGHAVETAVTTERNAVSMVYSVEAFCLAEGSLTRVLERPDDVPARGRMLLAAACAGLAIENSMLGAAHSMANPLTAQCGIAHGHAVGMMLPVVVRFNVEDPTAAAGYAELARAAGLCATGAAEAEAAAALVTALERLLDAAGVAPSLVAYGLAMPAVDALAAEAARQWTARFNPRPVTAADFRALFVQACS